MHVYEEIAEKDEWRVAAVIDTNGCCWWWIHVDSSSDDNVAYAEIAVNVHDSPIRKTESSINLGRICF